MTFKDLGLLVVDEEQRFGVAQKERIKQWRASVDVLAMSATPIPRTLHLSLAGMRDLSVIETPPKDRLAIETHVVAVDDGVIRERDPRPSSSAAGRSTSSTTAIESLGDLARDGSRLVPDARVAVGARADVRGRARAVDARVRDARERTSSLATTIVENGLDIPSANTMLIDRADLYGLSQLYQLRGRVGRSDKAAYC